MFKNMLRRIAFFPRHTAKRIVILIYKYNLLFESFNIKFF